MTNDAPARYKCPACRAISYNPTDRAKGYCGRCNRWAEDVFPEIAALGLGTLSHLCMRDGVVCGLGEFVFTTAVLVGMSLDLPYERRYCYERDTDALVALMLWDGTGHPSGPWLKVKGIMPDGTGVDELGPGALLA